MPNCPFCHAPIVWMGTTGGKRMPIDARLKDLMELHLEWEKEGPDGKKTGVESFKKVKGYTSHLTTCPHAKRFSSRDEKTKTVGG